MQEQIAPFHKNLRQEGLQAAYFMLNRETGEAVGVAIWDKPQKLEEVEGPHPSTVARDIRSPESAPTEYTKLRAQWIQELGGAMTHSEWYDLSSQV